MTFSNPIIPPVSILKNDNFGRRNLGKGWHFHNGVDLRPKSNNIYASHEGVVTQSARDQFGGLWIEITNGNQRSRYVHNSQNLVRAGQRVERGQLIGYIGATGLATGRHLHFETWINGQRVDPRSVVDFNSQPYKPNVVPPSQPTPPPPPTPAPAFDFDLVPKNGHIYMICKNGNGVRGNVRVTRVNAGHRSGTMIPGVNRLDDDDWNNPVVTNYDPIGYLVSFNGVTKQFNA